MTNWEQSSKLISWNCTSNCWRTQCQPSYGHSAFEANKKSEKAGWMGASGIDCKSKKLSFWSFIVSFYWASLVAQMVKNLHAMQGACSQSIPGSGRSLEEGLATHPSILAWRSPWTEEPGGLQSMGSQKIGTWLKQLSMPQNTHICTRMFLATFTIFRKPYNVLNSNTIYYFM